jgi:hypothetical protein
MSVDPLCMLLLKLFKIETKVLRRSSVKLVDSHYLFTLTILAYFELKRLPAYSR